MNPLAGWFSSVLRPPQRLAAEDANPLLGASKALMSMAPGGSTVYLPELAEPERMLIERGGGSQFGLQQPVRFDTTENRGVPVNLSEQDLIKAELALEAVPVLGSIPIAGMARGMGKADDIADAIAGVSKNPLVGSLAPDVAPVRGKVGRELAAMQRSTLAADEMQAWKALQANNPDLKRISKYFTPKEVQSILRAKPGFDQQMMRVIGTLPKAKEMAAVAKAGAPKLGWYRESTQALIDLFGELDATRFAALLAATSPQNSVEINLMNSLNIWKNWTAAGRPTDRAAIKRVMGASVAGTKGEQSILPAWIENTVTALTNDDPIQTVLKGPKVDSFMRNLADDVYSVTNDTWQANWLGVRQPDFSEAVTMRRGEIGDPGYAPTYLGVNALTRQAGDILGWYPSEVQETSWSLAKSLLEEATRLGIDPREVLQRGLLTPELIRGTPDFATLFRSPLYGDILRDAGYGDALEALTPHQFGAVMDLTPSEQSIVERVAGGNLAGLMQQRGLEARYRATPAPGQRRGILTTQVEAVPGVETGIMPGFVDERPGVRARHTDAMRRAMTDPRGVPYIEGALAGPQYAPMQQFTGQGVFANPLGDIEYNKVMANPVEVPLRVRGGLPTAVEDKAEAAATIQGAMLGQYGTPYSVMVPDPEGVHAVVPRTKGITDLSTVSDLYPPVGLPPITEMRYAPVRRRLQQGEDLFLADRGTGVSVINVGNPLYGEDIDYIARSLQRDIPPAKRKEPWRATEAADINRNYVDLVDEWHAGEGSRKVTDRVINAVSRLSKTDQKRLDSPQIKQMAGDILEQYEDQVARGRDVRADLLNFLRVVRKGGISALKDAVDEGQLLPAIGALGLGPAVYSAFSEGEPGA